MTNPRLIKKYKNRRLYDLELSQYITVDDLQRYVLDDLTFKVIEASSGKDITNATLLQIFVEMESHSTQFLSSDMLRQLIVLAHHPMNQSFKTMLEHMMTMKNKLQNDLYMSDYQHITAAWNKQSEQLINQWLAMFQRS